MGQPVLVCLAVALGVLVADRAIGAPLRPWVGHGRGIASWYGPRFEGLRMANGKPFRMRAMTGASRVLPLGTWLRVTNLANGRVCVIEITDRGPYIPGRVLDLSLAAAEMLDMVAAGIVMVSYEPLR